MLSCLKRSFGQDIESTVLLFKKLLKDTMDTPLTQFLEAERKKSNDNLIAERDKTNFSRIDALGKTERQTDKSVQEERFEADQTTASSRITADSNRDIEREALNYNFKDEQKSSDDRLLFERNRSDNAVEQERSRMDVVIDRERNNKNAIENRMRDHEREQTNSNLITERTRTDASAHYASNLLSDEISEHTKTKVSLTTRDEFLAIVSHDLRNPIGAISSCAEILLEDPTYQNLDVEIKQWISFMKRNADTSLRLISDILDMERIAEGKLELKLQKQCIGKIIRESMESYVHSASAKSVFLLGGDSTMDQEVLCDRDRILQIFSNLIGNALKFTPAGGSIIVNTTATESEVIVSIRDTGPGIPPEKIDFIFDRFTQLQSQDRRGLGLGLYISKMLIEIHQGRLWVDSKFGEGSTFYFGIPKI